MFIPRPSQELYRRVFELTVALYRVTDNFPKDEVLRVTLRAKANEIFESAVEYGRSTDIEREVAHLTRKIDALKGYLGIARAMRLVRPVNFTVLEREYDTLSELLAGDLAFLQQREQEAEERIRGDRKPAESGDKAGEKHADRIRIPDAPTAVPRSMPPVYPVRTPPTPVRSSHRNSRGGRYIPIGRTRSTRSNGVYGNKSRPLTAGHYTPQRRSVGDNPAPRAQGIPKERDKSGTPAPGREAKKLGAEVALRQTRKADHKGAGRRLSDSYGMNERQLRIMGHLTKAKRAKISEFYARFADISTKTIQRDLQNLVERRLLAKEGDKRWTTYVLR